MNKQEIIDALLEAFPNQVIVYTCTEIDTVLHSVAKLLREHNWYINIIPQFYKDKIDYSISIQHYNSIEKELDWDYLPENVIEDTYDTYEEALYWAIMITLNTMKHL